MYNRNSVTGSYTKPLDHFYQLLFGVPYLLIRTNSMEFRKSEEHFFPNKIMGGYSGKRCQLPDQTGVFSKPFIFSEEKGSWLAMRGWEKELIQNNAIRHTPSPDCTFSGTPWGRALNTCGRYYGRLFHHYSPPRT